MSISSARRLKSLSGKDPATYRPHLLHGEGRTYQETNCYSDIIIELLHACGYEPDAAPPPQACPKCYCGSWERFPRPGSTIVIPDEDCASADIDARTASSPVATTAAGGVAPAPTPSRMAPFHDPIRAAYGQMHNV